MKTIISYKTYEHPLRGHVCFTRTVRLGDNAKLTGWWKTVDGVLYVHVKETYRRKREVFKWFRPNGIEYTEHEAEYWVCEDAFTVTHLFKCGGEE